MTQILESAARVTSQYQLAAYLVAALLVIAVFVFRRQAKPSKALMALLMTLMAVSALAPIASSTYLANLEGRSLYRIRVTVLGPDGIPADDAKVWITSGGEPKSVSGGWQFDVPIATVPAGGKVKVTAARKQDFSSGDVELLLGADRAPNATIQLRRDTSARVRGMIVDSQGRAIQGARVMVSGYADETVLTGPSGAFELAAHAAEGQQILLHAEHPKFGPVNQHVAGGDVQVQIRLTHR